MKKLLLILSILLCISCSIEETEPSIAVKDYAEPVTNIVEEENKALPVWIEGEFYSRLIPTSLPSIITSETMYFDFTSFGGPVLDFGVMDIEYYITPTQVTIYCSDTELILLRKNDDPSNTDIQISYINNNIIYAYGMFKRV